MFNDSFWLCHEYPTQYFGKNPYEVAVSWCSIIIFDFVTYIQRSRFRSQRNRIRWVNVNILSFVTGIQHRMWRVARQTWYQFLWSQATGTDIRDKVNNDHWTSTHHRTLMPSHHQQILENQYGISNQKFQNPRSIRWVDVQWSFLTLSRIYHFYTDRSAPPGGETKTHIWGRK